MLNKCLLLPLILCTLTGCGVPPQSTLPTATASTPIAVSTSTSPTVAPVTPTLVPSPSFTSTPLPTRYTTRQPTITSMPTQVPPIKTPTITPTSVPVVAAPPGLVYSDSKGQWQIAADGKPTLIITGTSSLVSPNGQMAIKFSDCCHCNCDGIDQLVNLITGSSRNLEPRLGNAKWSADSKYIYYTSPRFGENLSDIWVYDVATGIRRNLTNTPARDEDWMVDWPTNSEFLAFYSTLGIPDGEGWIGYLTIMRTDGSGYQVISQQGVSSPVAFSPDGHTIAYAADGPWYYRIGSQPQRFPWKSFGLSDLKDVYFSSPAWSPDGLQLAWQITHFAQAGVENDQTVAGVVVFDLTRGTSRLWLDFTLEGILSWRAPSWDTRGKHLLFFGQKKNGAPYGLWLGDLQTGKVRLLIPSGSDDFCDWAWQPDGQWLAFQCDDTKVGSGIWLAELETGKLLKTNLPDDAQIRGWVNPQP